MAHQTDVYTVHQTFKSDNPSEKVIDPVCGMTLERQNSKNMIFRETGTLYFCSRQCEEKFLDSKYQKKQAG